jgi:hypothetical protein
MQWLGLDGAWEAVDNAFEPLLFTDLRTGLLLLSPAKRPNVLSLLLWQSSTA